MISERRLFEGRMHGSPSKSAGAKASGPAISLEAHAANRLMFGPRPGDVHNITQQGYEAFLAEQLDPMSIDDSECTAMLGQIDLSSYGDTMQQLYDRRSMSYDVSREPIIQVRWATWARIFYSKRQLNERMVSFWHDHFNIFGWDSPMRSMFTNWDATIRTHTFGNFRAIVGATAQHICMLHYLDNYLSTNGGPNENYARELIELHTMGAMHYQVEGGYIDQDVYEASRCLTGWSYDRDSDSPTRGEFKYNHDNHDRFIKFVLGTMIPGDQGPMVDGNQLLDMLCYHPMTARHIAWKLCVHFIEDFPSDDIVDSTTDVFYANRYSPEQIKLTLLHLLSSDAFKNAQLAKFKRPLDWVASTVRALNIPFTTSGHFNNLYDPMGQEMFGWRTPDGAPDHMAFWASSNGMIQRWNFIYRIASGWYSSNAGLQIPTEDLIPAELRNARDGAWWWLDRVFQRPVSVQTMDALREFMAEGRNWTATMPDDEWEEKSHHIAAMTVMTPEFMYR